ncbi:hypothetical protein CAEBREN_28291, partial [Caenorhabditis brenneri]
MNLVTENEKRLLQRIAQLEQEKRQIDLRRHEEKQRMDDDLFALEIDNQEKQEKIDKLEKELEKTKQKCQMKVLEEALNLLVSSQYQTDHSDVSHKTRELMNELEEATRRSSLCFHENARLKEANDQLRAELSSLRVQQREVDRTRKMQQVRQEKLESRNTRFSPYDPIRNHEYKNKRVDLAISELRKIAGQEDPTQLVNDALKKMGKQYNLTTKLTDYEGFLFYHDAHMTRESYSKMRRSLKKKKLVNPFPPLNAIIKMELKHGPTQIYEIKQHLIDKKEGSGKKLVISAEMKDVKEFLIGRLQELATSGKLIFDACTGEKIWLAVTGDKGGEEFKLSLAIGNMNSPNSCYSLIPVGVFNDEESAENISRFIPNVVEQLNILKEVKLVVNGEEKVFEVVQFLCGDLKNLYEMVGHQGACSKYHCLFCYLDEKGQIKNYKKGTARAMRSEEGYVEDSMRASTRKNANQNHARRNVKLHSHFVFSNIKLANVIPPSLHILMGISQKYAFNRLLRLAREMDNRSGKELQKTKLATERKEKAKIIELEKDVSDLTEHLEFLLKISRVVLKFRNKMVDGSDDDGEGSCEANWCFYRDKEMSDVEQRLVECGNCDNYFHGACAGAWSQEAWERAKSAQGDFFCFRCTRTSEENINKQILQDVDEMKEDVDVLEKELQKEKESYENRLKAVGGHLETTKLLESAWRSLGADISAWQQNFVGNHVMKLLDPA